MPAAHVFRRRAPRPRLGKTARYCSKPEKWYYMETQQENGLKKWLQARTVGLYIAWSRPLQFHLVWPIKAVVWTPPLFVQDAAHSSLRSPGHLDKYPGDAYPDPLYYLSTCGGVCAWLAARGPIVGASPRGRSRTNIFTAAARCATSASSSPRGHSGRYDELKVATVH